MDVLRFRWMKVKRTYQQNCQGQTGKNWWVQCVLGGDYTNPSN